MPGMPEGPGPDDRLMDVKSHVAGILDTHDEQVGGALEETRTGVEDVAGRLATLHATMGEVVRELYALDEKALDNAAALSRAEKTSQQTAGALRPVVAGSGRDVVSGAPGAIVESAAPLEDVKVLAYSAFDFMGAAAKAEQVKEGIEALQQQQASAQERLGQAKEGMTATSTTIRDAVNAS